MFRVGATRSLAGGLFVAVGSMLALGSCDSLQVTVAPVQAVHVSPAALELVTGEVSRFLVSAVDGGGSTVAASSVQWTAGNPSVVQVDPDGTVTGLGPGVSAVTALVDGVAGSAVVSVGVPGTLVVSASELDFHAVMGAGDPAPQVVQLRPVDGLVRALTVSVDYGSGLQGWVVASIDSDRAPATLSVAAETAGLPRGDYSARLSVASESATNGAVDIFVSLHVDDVESRVELTPGTLALAGFDTASVTVTHSGSGPGQGLASSIVYPTDGPSGWLTATLRGQATPTTLVLSSDPTGLSPGTHSAGVVVRSSSGAAADTLDVTMNVPLVPAGISLSPASVSFQADSGSAATASVRIGNTGNGPLGGLARSVSYGPGEPGGWLLVTLQGTSAPTVLNLVASTNGLSLGTYSASVEVAAAGVTNSPVYLPVVLTVSPVPIVSPAPPSGLSAIATVAPSVDLSWTDASSNESGFEIERSVPGGTWTLIQTNAADSTVFMDLSVTAGTTHDYQVRACNTAGCSAWSAPATVTVPLPPILPPTAPSNLTLVAPDSTTVDVSWDDNSTTEDGFELERRVPAGAWAAVHTTGPDATNFADTAVTPGATYEYQVRACNASGCSSWSSIQSVTVPASLPAVPIAPTGVAVAVVSAIHLDVDWTDNSNDETHFEIERSLSSGAWSAFASPPTNATTYRDNGLTAGTLVAYRVRACSAVGCSSWSASASGTTQDPKKVPRSPRQPRVLSASPQAVVLTWIDHSPDETYFEIEEYIPATGWTVIGTSDVNTTTWTDTAVDRGRQLQYHVRACNPVGCSGTWTATVFVP